MTAAKRLVLFGLALPGAYEDYPFGPEWCVLRHTGNKRVFALFYRWGDGTERVNLKCSPPEADFLRSAYESVLPGYHMNKTHWNTVILGGDVPSAELEAMLRASFALTRPRAATKRKRESR